MRALDRSVKLIRSDPNKAVALGRSHGLQGAIDTQRKYVEYIADGFQLRLSKENIEALLKVLKIDRSSTEFLVRVSEESIRKLIE